jgi:hypothetical protein
MRLVPTQPRAERSGAGAFLVRPLGGSEGRQGAAVCARCRADGALERCLAAQRCAGAVQRRRGLSRCTDRSAGGCADRHTEATACARAWGGLDAAEASPRRCVSWRSRGRRWRGLSARATDRPCRISAVPAGSLTPARPGVPGTPLVREPVHDSAPPAADSAGEGSHVSLPGQTRAVTSLRVVHTSWGKPVILVGKVVLPAGAAHPAYWGSRGRRLGRGRRSRDREQGRTPIRTVARWEQRYTEGDTDAPTA